METKQGELLQIVRKTGVYGVRSIRQLLPSVCHTALREKIEHHAVMYQTMAKKAERMLYDRGILPRELCACQKMMQWVSIKMNTLKKQDTASIAKMMVLGCTMGLIEMHAVLNHQEQKDEEGEQLCQELLQNERDMIESMAQYL